MGKWSEDQIKFLKENYTAIGAVKCAKEIGKSDKAVGKRARELGLKKIGWCFWSNNELSLLKHSWETCETMELLLSEFPNRNYRSICAKANELGYKTKTNRKRKGSLLFLDNITDKSAYWWGFIIGDGCIHKSSLMIGLQKSDGEHLRKLCEHLKITESKTNEICAKANLTIEDKLIVEGWRRSMEFNGPKTYNPPKLDMFLNKKYLKQFLIGLIDADGHIRLQENKKGYWASITIELNESWLSILKIISGGLITDDFNISITEKTNKKTCKIRINGNDSVIKLYKTALFLDYMGRKWDKIKVIM